MEKRMRKHVRSTIFVLLLLLGAFFVVAPDSVFAAQDGDYTYTVSGGVATITGYTGVGGAIIIPSTLGGYDTVVIGQYAFQSCPSLTSVVIPSSVTTIGSYAFSYCTALTMINVSASNPNFASVDGVLYNKAVTTLVHCPGGKSGAFTILNSITSVMDGAFSGCTALTSLDIPNSVISIGDYAFQSCTSLISVTIPSSVTSIGKWTFYHCTSLISVIIPSSITSIGDSAFESCANLTSVIIPSSVTSIGIWAFQSCHSLTEITVAPSNPNYSSVDGVLYNKEITNLIQCPGGWTGAFTILSSVTSIEYAALYFCPSLTAITVAPSNQNYTSVDGVLYDKAITALVQYPCGRAGGEFTIPGGVASIGNNAFYNCIFLTSVIIPNSVTSIGNWAFAYCGLTSTTLSDNVISIGAGAFHFCISLTSAIIPNGVTTIGNGAFSYCTSLTSITFLGLVAPTSVGYVWIQGTNVGIRGHTHAASNFPAPGGVFYGLIMGSVIPVAVPGTLTNLIATPANAQVVLAWNFPADNGGSDITGYRVYRSITESGTYSMIASPSGLNYTDAGLTNGQTYWYKISAVNAIGEGVNCSAISIQVPQPVTPANDYTFLLLLVIIAIAAILIVLLVSRKRKK